MNTPSHDFVTVDMRGLKAALVARAYAQRVSVSMLVRGAVARDLGLADVAESDQTAAPAGTASRATRVKLSIRMAPEAAQQLAAAPIWLVSLPACPCCRQVPAAPTTSPP
jgi:hypothetical protein